MGVGLLVDASTVRDRMVHVHVVLIDCIHLCIVNIDLPHGRTGNGLMYAREKAKLFYTRS